MYTATLYLHSYLRWAVVLAGVALVVVTASGWRTGRSWSSSDDRLHSAFIGFVDLQFMAGLALYTWLSPLTPAFFADPWPGMKVPTLRFFMLDHPVSMFAAIAVVHVWRKKSQGVMEGRRRHRQVALSTATALALMLASIPWPGLAYGRELFRMRQENTRELGLPLSDDHESALGGRVLPAARGRRIDEAAHDRGVESGNDPAGDRRRCLDAFVQRTSFDRRVAREIGLVGEYGQLDGVARGWHHEIPPTRLSARGFTERDRVRTTP